jgi:hypothetical protein
MAIASCHSSKLLDTLTTQALRILRTNSCETVDQTKANFSTLCWTFLRSWHPKPPKLPKEHSYSCSKVCIHIFIYKFIHTCMYICTLHTYTSIYVYFEYTFCSSSRLYTYMCMCIYTYIYYTHILCVLWTTVYILSELYIMVSCDLHVSLKGSCVEI